MDRNLSWLFGCSGACDQGRRPCSCVPDLDSSAADAPSRMAMLRDYAAVGVYVALVSAIGFGALICWLMYGGTP